MCTAMSFRIDFIQLVVDFEKALAVVLLLV